MNSYWFAPWLWIAKMPNDRPAKIISVAISVCLVCSILVSSAAVLLKPTQDRNAALSRKQEILKVARLYEPGRNIEQTFAERIETRYVDMHDGSFVNAELARQQQPETIPKQTDIARIGERLPYQAVYIVSRDTAVDTIILPLEGKGLWSTMYGFVALSADGNTVKGITFYDHGETPGLGGEISNPAWQQKWEGKQITDADGEVQLSVIKGSVNPQASQAKYQIDGLSGATLTSNGVTRTIHYWLGEAGFGPFLNRLSQQQPGSAG